MIPQIYGVGTSRFGRQPEHAAHTLGWQAVLEAVKDAGTEDVDAAYVGSVFSGSGVAQRTLQALGFRDIPVVTVENACASGTTALYEAHQAIVSGRYERVLVLGLEHMTTRFRGGIHPELTDSEGASGLGMPAVYGMAAARYRGLGMVTDAQLASVSVKNHRHALGNDRAQYSGRYTIEEVLASPMISDPLTLLQCCPISDGAAAAVVGVPRGVSTDVPIRGIALRSGAVWDHRSEHVWGFDLVRATALDAFQAASVGPEDVHVYEVHDAFTIGEIVTVEALGITKLGEAGAASLSGYTALGGKQPVNPSGGLLSRGHPLGATGLAQLAEIVWQLQGRAGARQVNQATLGVVETMGGGVASIDGNGCVVAVLGG